MLFSVLAASTGIISLSGQSLTKHLRESPISVVFFAEENSDLSFADEGIEKFSNTVQFFKAPTYEVPQDLCKQFPCPIGFKDKRPVKIEPAPTSNKTLFMKWVRRVIEPSVILIEDEYDLSLIIESSNTPVVFAVDTNDVQAQLPQHAITAYVSSSLLKSAGITLSQGAYIRRAVDGEFIRLQKDYVKIVNTAMVPFSRIDQAKTTLISTFFVDADQDELHDAEMTVLEHFAGIYGHDVTFTYVPPKLSDGVMTDLGVQSLEFPIFIVFDKNNKKHRRWFVSGHHVYNMTTLEVTITEAIKNEKPHVISEPVPDPNNETTATYHKIVNSNFKDLVYDDRYETIVVFSKPDCIECEELRSIMIATGKLLNETLVKMYYIDVTQNDIPVTVPLHLVPLVMMWPAGKKDQTPFVYDGNTTVPGLIEFVKSHASHNVDVPTYSLENIKYQVSQYFTMIKDYANENEYVKKIKQKAKENEYVVKLTAKIKEFIEEFKKIKA